MDNIREEIVNLALSQYGKPYVWGSHGPNSFDCAGLIWYIYKKLLDIDIYQNGFGLSTTTRMMTGFYGLLSLYGDSLSDKDLSNINAGDILFFHNQSLEDNLPGEDNRYPGHCGIYLSNGIFIHCSRKKGRVVISDFNKNPYWNKVLVGSKDIISDIKVLKKTRG